MAQDDPRADSLRSLLAAAQGEKRFDVLTDLFIHYSPNNYQEALRYSEEALALSYQIGDSLLIVKGGRMKSNALTSLGKYDDAIGVLNTMLPIAKRNKLDKQILYILNSIALGYTYRGSYDKALEYHFQSLVLREKEGDKQSISICLNNIGLVYYKLKDNIKALDYYSRSLAIKKSIGYDYDLDRLYTNMGLSYNQLHKHRDAIETFNKAIRSCGENCNEDIRKQAYSGLGMAYFGMRDFATAEQYFLRSLEVARVSSDNLIMAENLLFLGKIKVETNGDIHEALQNLLQAEKLVLLTDHVEDRIDVYDQLALIYTKLNDFQKASDYQKKYIHLKDSVFSEQLISNLTKVQTKFEERKNIQTIADQDEALSRQRLLNGAIAIIALLAGSLVFVLYRSVTVTKRVNAALSEAKGVIEAQNLELTKAKTGLESEVNLRTKELKVANESLKRVNEELDNFIYKTSHDIRGPLASLKGICNVAIMDVKDPMALDYLKKLDDTASRLNIILTRLLIINQINHATLTEDDIDFESIVDDVILLERKRGLPATLKIEREIIGAIRFRSDASLLRIILENLIDNAIKFYNDSQRIEPFVKVRIGMEGDQVGIHVIDNGIGITEADPDKIFQMFSRASERSGTGGIGLYLSKLATEKLGGEINFRTTPEKHTEFYVLFPVHKG
jgi:signal transduction histidine kinase